jgi:adenosylcobinamide-GDP ribazoletransferase
MAAPALRGVRAALVFLTRIPAGGFPYTADDLRWASAHFPLIGALLGGLAVTAFRLLEPAGATVASAASVALLLLVTGAFHEDGLADTADALGGGMDRERVLAILKDSRIGAFGAAALVSTLVLRVALWAKLGASAPEALVVAQTASRVGPVWLMTALPYVTDPDAARSRDLTRAGFAQGAIATAWLGALLAALYRVHHLDVRSAAIALGASALSVLVCAWRFRARVGGITGDFLGATQQISELVLLVAWARA